MSGWYPDFGKRVLDILGAGVALVVLSPFLIFVWCAIRLEDGGPALFVQERVGRGSKPFRLCKYRSMPIDTEDVPSAQAAALRITWVGGILRRTNIDELPQLINVLRGDMSLVGPRPALASQRELLDLRWRERVTELKPGLTGLAQINSYDGMPDIEKAQWDGRYARSVSLMGDLLIMVRTLGYLLRRPPVY